MKIEIDNERIRIGPDSVRYCPFYLNVKTLKVIVKKWLPLLRNLSHEKDETLLPYSLDDEFIEAFRTTLRNNYITLRCVILDAVGFDSDIDKVEDYIFRPAKVIKEYPQEFGRYKKDELLTALRAI